MSTNLGLAWLLDPVEPAQFLEDHYETRPLWVQRAVPDWFADVMTTAELDRALCTTSLRPDSIRVLKDGRDRPLDEALLGNLGEPLALEGLHSELRDGATVVVKYLHERHAAVSRLCRALSDELSARLQVNVYITPPGHQGLPVHYDTHDVFVLQIAGRKHWTLYPSPVQLPLRSQPFHAERHSQEVSTQALELSPGQTLYVPRGVSHQAKATDSLSVHLTVGIHPVTPATLLRDALERALETDPVFRRALPPGFIHDDDARAKAIGQLDDAIAHLTGRVTAESLLDVGVRVAKHSRVPDLTGYLVDLAALEDIDIHTRVQRRPGSPCTLAVRADRVVLHLLGKEVDLPGHTRVDLEHLMGGQPTSAASLPGTLDASGRVVLIRRLVREGLLTHVA